MRPRFIVLAVIALVVAGIGYVAWDFAAPGDLALVSTVVVDQRDPRAVRAALARPGEVYALVTFDTAVNLARVGHNAIYIYLFSTTHICDQTGRPTDDEDVVPDLVFDESGREITGSNYDNKGRMIVPPDAGPGRHRYHVFVQLRGAVGKPNDLIREPRDLCIQIFAHEMMAPDIHTNVVRVPAAALREAIARYRAGLNSSAS